MTPQKIALSSLLQATIMLLISVYETFWLYGRHCHKSLFSYFPIRVSHGTLLWKMRHKNRSLLDTFSWKAFVFLKKRETNLAGQCLVFISTCFL